MQSDYAMCLKKLPFQHFLEDFPKSSLATSLITIESKFGYCPPLNLYLSEPGVRTPAP